MMTEEQKQFIREKLIPFIKREHGNGFSMHYWIKPFAVVEYMIPYLGNREPPSCGTVACIGGSLQILLFGSDAGVIGRHLGEEAFDRKVEEATGLTLEMQKGLFYHYQENNFEYRKWAWPKDFAVRLGRATDAQQQADITEELLEMVVATDCQILRTKVGEDDE